MPRGLLVFSLLVSACGAAVNGPPSPAGGAAVQPASSAAPAADMASGPAGGLGERRSEGGAVEVVASWPLADPPSLKLVMDTHSVDLDRVDVATVVRLRVDGGDWIASTQSDAPKGGHHRSATLTFGSLASATFASARVIELRVTDVGVPERLLRWERAG